MDPAKNAVDMVPLASNILLLLLNAHHTLSLLREVYENEDESDDEMAIVHIAAELSTAAHAVAMTALRHYRIFTVLAGLEEDLGFWVKPRSTTWFATFLLHEYDDERWIQMFRMSKCSVL